MGWSDGLGISKSLSDMIDQSLGITRKPEPPKDVLKTSFGDIDISKAPSYASTVGGTLPYGMEFTVGDQTYKYIPKEVVQNGGLQANRQYNYTSWGVPKTATTTDAYVFDWFLNKDNINTFAKNASPVDMSNTSAAKYLTDNNLGTDGYLVRADKVPFDSTAPRYIPDRVLNGLKGNGDQIVAGLAGGHGNSYVSANGDVHDPYTTSSSILGDVFGGFGQGAADIINNAFSSFNSLGPLGVIAGNAIAPGVGSALAAGQTAGRALATGDLSGLGGLATNLAAGELAAATGIGGGVADATGVAPLGNAAQGAVAGLIATGDPEKAIQAGINAGVGAGVNQALNTPTDQQLEDWSRQQAQQNYENTPSPTEQDVLAADSNVPLPSPLSSSDQQTGPGYFDEETGKFVPSKYGQYNGPLTDASGTNFESMVGYSYNPETNVWTTPEGETVDLGYLSNTRTPYDASWVSELEKNPAAFDPETKTNYASLLKTALDEAQRQKVGSQRGQTSRALGLASGACCGGIPWLDTRAQMLKGIDVNDQNSVVNQPTGGLGGIGGAQPTSGTNFVGPAIMPSHQTDEVTGFIPDLSRLLTSRGFNLAAAPHSDFYADGGEVQKFACGSSAMSFCSAMSYMNQLAPKFYSTKCTMLVSPSSKRSPLTLAQLKQMQPHISSAGNIGGMARGGLPAKYQEAAPEGHHPEFITGITGYYAGGRGTGQSDDIDAMLHDGDYVIDAEAVSALGDGSSKAGNEVLMHFMHQIPHDKDVGEGKPVPAKIADGEVVLPESFVTALGGGDNKRGARMLDEMRQRLRDHKRSAPNSKIPPKAKSPLEYLKGVKG